MIFSKTTTYPNAGRLLLVLVVIGMGPAGCGGFYGETGALDGSGGDGLTIEDVREIYRHEKYFEAIVKSKEFMRLNPGSRFLDEAQLLLARSEYEEGNYIEAEDRFRRLMRDFPNSPYAEDAAYYLPLSILSQSRKAELDQRETQAAKAQFKSFLMQYPDSQYRARAEEHLADIDKRLARKDFLNGETYRKMRRLKSAVFYYKKVAEQWSESPYAEESVYRLGEVFKERKLWDKALLWSNRYLESHPQGPFADKSKKIRDESQEKMSSNPPDLSGDDGS